MRSWEKFVSATAVSVIVAGAVYAYDRERLAHTDLHQMYQDLNRRRFEGKLPDIPVQWGNLQAEKAYGETRQFQDGLLVIVLDKYTVTSQKELDETMRHEMAHICAGVEHGHDDKFRECVEDILPANTQRPKL